MQAPPSLPRPPRCLSRRAIRLSKSPRVGRAAPDPPASRFQRAHSVDCGTSPCPMLSDVPPLSLPPDSQEKAGTARPSAPPSAPVLSLGSRGMSRSVERAPTTRALVFEDTPIYPNASVPQPMPLSPRRWQATRRLRGPFRSDTLEQFAFSVHRTIVCEAASVCGVEVDKVRLLDLFLEHDGSVVFILTVEPDSPEDGQHLQRLLLHNLFPATRLYLHELQGTTPLSEEHEKRAKADWMNSPAIRGEGRNNSSQASVLTVSSASTTSPLTIISPSASGEPQRERNPAKTGKRRATARCNKGNKTQVQKKKPHSAQDNEGAATPLEYRDAGTSSQRRGSMPSGAASVDGVESLTPMSRSPSAVVSPVEEKEKHDAKTTATKKRGKTKTATPPPPAPRKSLEDASYVSISLSSDSSDSQLSHPQQRPRHRRPPEHRTPPRLDPHLEVLMTTTPAPRERGAREGSLTPNSSSLGTTGRKRRVMRRFGNASRPPWVSPLDGKPSEEEGHRQDFLYYTPESNSNSPDTQPLPTAPQPHATIPRQAVSGVRDESATPSQPPAPPVPQPPPPSSSVPLPAPSVATHQLEDDGDPERVSASISSTGLGPYEETSPVGGGSRGAVREHSFAHAVGDGFLLIDFYAASHGKRGEAKQLELFFEGSPSTLTGRHVREYVAEYMDVEPDDIVLAYQQQVLSDGIEGGDLGWTNGSLVEVTLRQGVQSPTMPFLTHSPLNEGVEFPRASGVVKKSKSAGKTQKGRNPSTHQKRKKKRSGGKGLRHARTATDLTSGTRSEPSERCTVDTPFSMEVESRDGSTSRGSSVVAERVGLPQPYPITPHTFRADDEEPTPYPQPYNVVPVSGPPAVVRLHTHPCDTAATPKPANDFREDAGEVLVVSSGEAVERSSCGEDPQPEPAPNPMRYEHRTLWLHEVVQNS